MSNIDEIAATDLEAVLDATSPSSPTDTVIYTPASGIPTSPLQATIEPINVADPDRGPNSRDDMKSFRASFQTADLAVPNPDAVGTSQLTFDGNIYGMTSILSSDAVSWTGRFEYSSRARMDTGDSTREGI